MLLNSRKHPDFCGHQSWVKGDWRLSPCELRDSCWGTSSQWQTHLAPPSLATTTHLGPACGTQPAPETDGFSFSSLFQLKLLQIVPKVSPSCLGRVLRKAPSLLLLSAIDSSLLIAVVSFSQTLCSQMCGLITLSSPFQQLCSETHLGKHVCRRHWEWLWTYDPNYFWFPAWMILSASGLSLSNLWHSKFPHSVLK